MLVAPYHPHFSTFPPDANLLSPSSPLQQHYSLDTGLAASSSPSFDHIPSQSPHSRATPSSHHTTFDSTPAFDLAASTSTRTPPETLTRYMSDPLYFQNPAIGIQQSTPVPQQSQGRGWSGFEPSHGPLAAGAYPPQNYARRHSHQRGVPAPSIASPASATAASSFYRSASFSMAPADHSPALSNKFDSYPSADQARMFSNNLPTPTQTPTQDSFGPRPSSHYNNTAPRQTLGPTMTATMAMKQECDQNALGDDELPGLNHSARHSVSSFGNSPSTPHTAPPEETGEGAFKMPAIGENASSKVESWIDAYLTLPDDADTVRAGVFSASPATVMASPARSQRSQGYLSPFPSGNPQLAELLQEANKNRSGSPNVSTRPISPFRQDSPYFEVPPHGVGSAAQMRQRRQHMEAQAMMARQAAPSRPDESQPPKTVSPKDVELDYDPHDDDSRMPLFPDGGEYSQPPDYGDNQYHPATHAPFGNVVSASPQSSFSFSSPAATALNGLSLPAQQYRPTGNLFGHESVPDFPAHLSSMESSASASEAAAEPAQSSAHSIAEDVPRPSSTLADTGTYSCTYHGCTQRFDSPQKLQSHKREGHRQHPPGQQSPSSQAIGSNMSSSALLARNSQAGPHKCERVNPTTGKPCNTIFSRPYDLTRHEDTIHNGRKQKVRCALCVEEKTFSRNDALTRHMRVVHPEVDFPGKHRRRGGATA